LKNNLIFFGGFMIAICPICGYSNFDVIVLEGEENEKEETNGEEKVLYQCVRCGFTTPKIKICAF